jgi:NitT/TauT family transport system substrate-binding protein
MLFSSWSCRGGNSRKLESINIGFWPNEINTLIYIAQDRNYFVADGLNVTIRDYASVTEALNGMLNGESDISTASEFVLVGKALQREDIRALGSIDKVLQISIVFRKDRGIEKVSDLVGKKIGVFKGAVSEFYLGRFLELHGINESLVTLVDTSSLNIVDTLTNGTVDAVITGQPNIDKIGNILGQEVMIWPAQSNQATYYSIYSTGSWASEHPELIQRFLNSLVQAESYLIRNPDQARAIIQNKLNHSDEYMTEIWQEHEFSLTLDQGMVAAMEDEARWMINNNLTAEKQVPDFLDYIYIDGLEAVKPEAVNIIR